MDELRHSSRRRLGAVPRGASCHGSWRRQAHQYGGRRVMRDGRAVGDSCIFPSRCDRQRLKAATPECGDRDPPIEAKSRGRHGSRHARKRPWCWGPSPLSSFRPFSCRRNGNQKKAAVDGCREAIGEMWRCSTARHGTSSAIALLPARAATRVPACSSMYTVLYTDAGIPIPNPMPITASTMANPSLCRGLE